jgi:hypothetical protein
MNDVRFFDNALKHAFARAYGGTPSDWTVNPSGKAKELREFRNAKNDVVLQVNEDCAYGPWASGWYWASSLSGKWFAACAWHVWCSPTGDAFNVRLVR